jgi:hypothetical protein
MADDTGGHYLDTGDGLTQLDPLPEPPFDARWRRAHEAAHRLRQSLLAIGIRTTEVDTLTARDDTAGRPRVLIPALSPEAAECIIAALSPAIGPDSPYMVGRRDAAPLLPADRL